MSASVHFQSVPLMVWATSGTTVLGGFDPIDQLANICKIYNVWLHVDVTKLLAIQFYHNGLIF